MFSEKEWRRLMGYLELPPRQEETLRLLFNGHTDKEIAVPTVRTYLQRMYHKLGVSDRTALVIRIFQVFRELEREMNLLK